MFVRLGGGVGVGGLGSSESQSQGASGLALLKTPPPEEAFWGSRLTIDQGSVVH